VHIGEKRAAALNTVFFQTAFKLLVISFLVIVVYEYKGPKCLSEKRKMMNLPNLALDCMLAIKI